MFVYGAYAASIYASSVLAAHRFIAAVFPLSFRRFTKKPAIVSLIILPWLISLIINIFPTVGYGLRVVPFNKAFHQGGCTFAVTSRVVPKPFPMYTIFSYFMPTGIMGVLYTIVLTRIYRKIRKKGTTASIALKRRFEITRTLFVSFVWLCIAVGPINLVASYAAWQFATNTSLQLFLRWLSTSFGCMNPVSIYEIVRVKEAQRAVWKHKCLICIKQQQQKPTGIGSFDLVFILQVFFWATSKLFHEGVKDLLRYGWWQKMGNRGVSPGAVMVSGSVGGDTQLRKKRPMSHSRENAGTSNSKWENEDKPFVASELEIATEVCFSGFCFARGIITGSLTN